MQLIITIAIVLGIFLKTLAIADATESLLKKISCLIISIIPIAYENAKIIRMRNKTAIKSNNPQISEKDNNNKEKGVVIK